MIISNCDTPISPCKKHYGSGFGTLQHIGLTKREHYCLTMGVPETGDTVLDDIIREGNRRKIAGLAMQGLLSNCADFPDETAKFACDAADALLKELDK